MSIIGFSPFIALSLILAVPEKPAHPAQGLEGFVYRVSGNQMPSPDRPPAAPKGVRTTLYIYRLTNLSEVTRKEGTPFFSAVSSQLVKKLETDSNGHFKVGLPEGRYSLFVRVKDFYFASTFDGQNNICPYTVNPDQFTEVRFTINYDAHY